MCTQHFRYYLSIDSISRLGALNSWAFVLFSNIYLLNLAPLAYYQWKFYLIVDYFFEKQICLTLCFSLIFILHLYLKYGVPFILLINQLSSSHIFMNCFIKFVRLYIIRSQRFINMMCKIKNIITNMSSSLYTIVYK